MHAHACTLHDTLHSKNLEKTVIVCAYVRAFVHVSSMHDCGVTSLLEVAHSVPQEDNRMTQLINTIYCCLSYTRCLLSPSYKNVQ